MYSKFNRVLLVLFTVCCYHGCDRLVDYGTFDDGIPPAIPSGLSLRYAGEGEVYFVWRKNDEPDFQSYIVYRGIAANSLVEIARTPNAHFFDDSLHYDTTYYYRLRAVDYFGDTSDYSMRITAVPKNIYAPGKIRNINCAGRNWENVKSIQLDWEPSAVSDIGRYAIFRGINESFTPDSNSYIADTRESFFADSSPLKTMTRYFYKIIPIDKGNLSGPPSEPVSDLILDLPVQRSPRNDSILNDVPEFQFHALNVPCEYEIIIQENPFFQEVWSTRFQTSLIDQILTTAAKGFYPTINTSYYWRVAAYTNASQPNALSKPLRFKVVY